MGMSIVLTCSSRNALDLHGQQEPSYKFFVSDLSAIRNTWTLFFVRQSFLQHFDR